MIRKQKNTILDLFIIFIKIGAFTFGGGYAMIPLIQREVVEKRKWVSDQDILDIIAIAESTPGPIAINVATFIGYKVMGLLGAIITTFGVVIPSFIIIFLVSVILNKFDNIQVVQYAFSGIWIGVFSLIIKSLIKMYKQCNKNLLSYIIMVMSFILLVFFDTNIFIILLSSAILATIVSLIKERRVK